MVSCHLPCRSAPRLAVLQEDPWFPHTRHRSPHRRQTCPAGLLLEAKMMMPMRTMRVKVPQMLQITRRGTAGNGGALGAQQTRRAPAALPRHQALLPDRRRLRHPHRRRINQTQHQVLPRTSPRRLPRPHSKAGPRPRRTRASRCRFRRARCRFQGHKAKLVVRRALATQHIPAEMLPQYMLLTGKLVPSLELADLRVLRTGMARVSSPDTISLLHL